MLPWTIPAIAAFAISLNLHGCGHSGDSSLPDKTTITTTIGTATTTTITTTTTTVKTATTSTLAPLPRPDRGCPEPMQASLRQKADDWAQRSRRSIAMAYAG